MRKPEANAIGPDDDRVVGVDALRLAEWPPPDAHQESLRAGFEAGLHPSLLMVAPPIDGVPEPDPLHVDLAASAVPAVAALGPLDSVLPAPGEARHEADERPGESQLLSLVGRLRPAGSDVDSPAVAAAELSNPRPELVPLEGDKAAGEEHSDLRSALHEWPHVSVISRETHFAPAQGPAPTALAVPPPNPQPDVSAPLAKGQTAKPDAPPQDDRLALAPDLPSAPLEPNPRPQNQEAAAPPHRSARATPAFATTTSSSTPAAAAAAPDLVGDQKRGLSQRVATPPVVSRPALASEEQPFVPARRFVPAEPDAPDLQPEPLRSAIAGPPPTVDPDTTILGTRPAPANPPPVAPGSMPQVAERGDRDGLPAGVVPASASATTEGAAPVSATSGLSPDVVQKVSGAIIEAAGSPGLATAAAPVATAAVRDITLASPPARALTIRIDLHDHGAVHVRLALNGNALSLRMRADREEVAEQLRQDHKELSDTLSAAGYDTEIVAIEGRRSEGAPLSASDTASLVETGADGTENADGGAGGEDRRPAARQAPAPDQEFGESLLHHDQDDHEARNLAQRRAGALYV